MLPSSIVSKEGKIVRQYYKPSRMSQIISAVESEVCGCVERYVCKASSRTSTMCQRKQCQCGSAKTQW